MEKNQNLKVYISGPLTYAPKPEKYKKFYEDLGNICSSLGLQPYVPHFHTDPWTRPNLSPSEIFFTDQYQVLSSGLIIAYVGLPSHGVGMELAIAATANIPIVLLYEQESKVSRFVRGIPSIIAELRYTSDNAVLKELYNILIALGYGSAKADKNSTAKTCAPHGITSLLGWLTQLVRVLY